MFLKTIPLLWLRQKLYYRFFSKEAHRFSHLFDLASLEFAPNTRLKLEPKDVGHQVIAFCGFYELKLTRKIFALAKEGGLFKDLLLSCGYQITPMGSGEWYATLITVNE